MNTFRLRKLNKILKKVNAFSTQMENLSDSELQEKTSEFKARLSKGESLDYLLPEAFSVVREAAKRVLGMFPYDVQVLGAIVLHQGDIAEMKTGEGKTLTATMPTYLNALTGKGVFVITTNDYLAKRDMMEMKPLFEFLGLTITVGLSQDDEELGVEQKKEIYQSDIVYTTQNALGFDYLIDNLATSLDGKYLRPFHYAIIDEVDAVLLDNAQMNLVISGSPKVQSNLHGICQQFIQMLERDKDIKMDEDEKNVWLTAAGIKKAEQFFNVSHLYDEDHFYLVRDLILALRANYLFEENKKYIVRNNEVLLVENETGRTLEGIKLSAGMHQALEAKEGVPITAETRAMASITYQNLFKLFDKISGMSGTAKVAEEEFLETYRLAVIQIPTNRPMIRVDYPDKIYQTLPEKLKASLEYILSIHRTGRPLLIITGNVQMSEIYSSLLLKEGIPHNVLNAHNAAREAMMIKEAGQMGNVTVATIMAGRGTDIKLGPGVAELGGLAVVGTERMSSRRVDLQISGRAGRQGDPGDSQFFVSLEDDLLMDFGPRWLERYRRYEEVDWKTIVPQPLKQRKFYSVVNQVQQSCDDSQRGSRSNVVQYDESVQLQRNMIYQERNRLLHADGESEIDLMSLIKEVIDDFLRQHKTLTAYELDHFILDYLSSSFTDFEGLMNVSKKQLSQRLMGIVQNELDEKRQMIQNEDEWNQFRNVAVLKAIDECWVEQIDTLELLKTVIQSRSYAQKNPIFEYHMEAYETFQKTQKKIKVLILRNLAMSYFERNDKGELIIHFP